MLQKILRFLFGKNLLQNVTENLLQNVTENVTENFKIFYSDLQMRIKIILEKGLFFTYHRA